MDNQQRNLFYKIMFILFIVSGFCGLLYQIVWLRLAFTTFGVITPVFSVVLSVFMLGLALGSWLGGKYIKILTDYTGKSAIFYYAITELIIGIGGILVPQIFAFGQTILLPAGDINSAKYLFLSSGILGISILPWCICMGATLPIAMAFIREFYKENIKSFSYLYLANVIGAMLGTILASMVMIEIFGFQKTLLFAVFFNFTIAGAAYIMNLRCPYNKSARGVLTEKEASPYGRKIEWSLKSILYAIILFTTGFVAMAQEVVWIRAYTPIMRTTIYAFAGILAVYLLATWLGSMFYRILSAKKIDIDMFIIIALLCLASFLPVLTSDFRLWDSLDSRSLSAACILMSIFPFCFTLGYLTPNIIDSFSLGNPEHAGKAYAINSVGCILGPLFAGYILLPEYGVQSSFVILAVPFFLLLAYYCLEIFLEKKTEKLVVTGILIVVFTLIMGKYFKEYVNYESKVYINGEVRRDYTATVISYGEGMKKQLSINGIGMTHLTPITKFMAHVPLAIVNPGRDTVSRGDISNRVNNDEKSILILCFGMGTTFRSAASWDIRTVAVELVPSVRDAFGFYFKDAEEILKKPNVEIVVDDGRRYLRRTSEKYDVITIDPPPPVESSGSGLLYSEQFYRILKGRLKDGGILAHWFPSNPGAKTSATLKAVANSIQAEFPFVRVFNSVAGWGYHFFASMTPFEMPSKEEFLKRVPLKARQDLIEWNKGITAGQFYQKLIGNEVPLSSIVSDDETFSVTDDRPYNEYYLLRETFKK